MHSYTPAHLAERILRARSAVEGERKQVTVLFCDIAESTSLAARLGPERMHSVLTRFFELALEQVHSYDGTVNQFLGDGFMALFGAPLALEDHALRAVMAALDIQRSFSQHPPHLIFPNEALGLRIGLNSGSVVVGSIGDNLRMDYTAIGDTTNVAARLQELAEPGAVLTSESVYLATAGWVEFDALGEHSLKGKSQPVPLFRAKFAHRHRHEPAPASATARPLLLVGREAELASIQARIESLARGEGGIVTIVADAGLGKSRLADEAIRLAQERGFEYLRGTCLSFGRKISHWPFREAIRTHFGIGEDDPEDVAWNRLRFELSLLFPEGADEVLPYLGALLALRIQQELADRTRYLDGLAMGQQVFRSLLRMFERMAQRRATVVVLEDWQWADESSVELLSHVLGLAGSSRMLFLVTSRPVDGGGISRALLAAIEADPSLGARHTQIGLSPLPAEHSIRVAENILKGSLPVAVRELLLDRAAGNPFFMEEIVRALVAGGALMRTDTGRWDVATALLTSTLLPPTIEGIIIGRIDRLEDQAKQVLKAAAVAGRTFFFRVLKALTELGVALEHDLVKLQGAQLVQERRRSPELEYAFQHPLLHQATYNSILAARRRDLHRKVGETLETLFAEQIEEFYPVLAHHFAESEDWGKAQRYLSLAGDQAGRIAADREALEHYQEALASAARSGAVPFDSTEHALLERKIGEALFRLGRHDQSITYLNSALQRLGVRLPRTIAEQFLAAGALVARFCLNRLLIRVGRKPRRPLVLERHDNVRAETLELVTLIEFYRDARRFLRVVLCGLSEVERHPQLPVRALLIAACGLVLDMAGVHGVARRFHDRASELANALGDRYRSGYCRLMRGLHQYVSGDWTAADESLQAASREMRELGHLRLWALASGARILVLSSGGDPRWLAMSPELLRVAAETGDDHQLGWASMTRGWSLMVTGDVKQGAAELGRACELLDSVPDYQLLPFALAHSALALVHLGRADAALPLLERSRTLRRQHWVRGHLATRALTAAAECYLALLESGSIPSGLQRSDLLRLAQRACSEALQHARTVHDHCKPDALRLSGMLQWQLGRHEAARTLFARSCLIADRIGARHVLAQARYEIGRRFDRRDELEAAEQLFMQAGALAEVAKTRRSLAGLQSRPRNRP